MINKIIKKKEVYILLLIIIFAGIFYFLNLTPDLGTSSDGARYVILAKSIVNNNKYSEINYPNQPADVRSGPLFPLILALFYYFFPDNFLIFKIIGIILTLVSFYILFYLLKEYTNTRNSLLITFIVSINTIILMNSTWILTDSLFLLLTITTLFLVKKYDYKNTLISYLLISLCLAAVLLTRGAGLTLLLSVFLYFFLKKNFVKSFFITAISLLLQLPWTIRNFIVDKNPPLIRTNVNYKDIFSLKDLYYPHKGYIDFLYFISRTASNIVDYVRIHLPSIFYPVFHAIEELGYSNNFYFFLSQVIFGTVILLLISYGFFLRFVNKPDILEIYVVLNVLMLIFYTGPYIRLVIPLIPFLILYFFDGLRNTLNKIFHLKFNLFNTDFKKIVFYFVIISIVATNVTANIFWINMQPYTSDKFQSFYEANDWIKENTPQDSIIAGSKSGIIYFHSNRTSYNYPYIINKTEMINIIYELNTDYIIIDSLGELSYIYLMPVIEEYKSNFTLVYKTDKPHTYVYKVD